MEVFGLTCVAGKEKGKPILSFCLVVVLLPAMRAIITIDPDSFFPKDVFPAVANQEKSYTQFLLHQYFSNLKVLNAIHCIQTVLTIRAPAVLTNFAIEPLFFGSLAKHGLVLQRQSFKLSFKSESSHIIWRRRLQITDSGGTFSILVLLKISVPKGDDLTMSGPLSFLYNKRSSDKVLRFADNYPRAATVNFLRRNSSQTSTTTRKRVKSKV